MFRNLSKRIELVTPVFSMSAKKRLWECLDICLRDQRQAWELGADGSWQRVRPEGNRDSCDGLGTHQVPMNLACQRAHVSVERKDTT